MPNGIGSMVGPRTVPGWFFGPDFGSGAQETFGVEFPGRVRPRVSPFLAERASCEGAGPRGGSKSQNSNQCSFDHPELPATRH